MFRMLLKMQDEDFFLFIFLKAAVDSCWFLLPLPCPATSLSHLFPPSLKQYQNNKNKSFWFPDLTITECRWPQLFFCGALNSLLQHLKRFQSVCGNMFCYQLDECCNLNDEWVSINSQIFICHKGLGRIYLSKE